MFLLISRAVTEDIKTKLQQLLNAGIDAYVIVDKDLERQSKRFITYDDDEVEKSGFMRLNVSHKFKEDIYRITGWDKAVYHAYKSGEKYVWFCEDDIFWNRPAVIKMILNEAENKKDDLLCFELAKNYETIPGWYHWPKAKIITPDKDKWMGTYNQFCRISSRLLGKVAKFANERKELLLHEPLFATLCNINKYKISYITDLKLPIFFEVRWAPIFIQAEIDEIVKNNSYVLLHPVKSLEANRAFQKEHIEAAKKRTAQY